MVHRLDGRMVNAGRKRGMLMVCVHGCCCGITERGFAPVPSDLYHQEWERRKLRNKVHLNQGGCLGPCTLANVAMLMLDGRPYWFHSLNEERLIIALYDYIDLLLAAETHVAPPAILVSHLFNGFAWDGMPSVLESSSSAGVSLQTPTAEWQLGEGIVVLTQADTDLLVLEQAHALLPDSFASVRTAHIGRQEDDASQLALLDALLPSAAVVVARLHSARSFATGLERLQRWAETSDGFLLCIPAVEALDPDLMARSTVGVPLAHLVSAYFQAGGTNNLAHALRCLSDHLLLSGWGYDPPQELPTHGVYSREASCDQSSCCSCGVTNIQAQVQPATQAAKVGILFYRAHLLSGNTAFVDAIIDELSAQGLQAHAVYTQSLKEAEQGELPTALKLLMADGPIDALINTLSFAIGTDEPHPFAQIDVPVIQAITAGVERDAWLRGGRGLGPLDTAMNVAIPEFDGRIISVPISFKEQPAAGGGARYVPDPERISRLVGLARRLTVLRQKPNAEKRIAVMFTNSSAKAQRVGNAVGLDSPASLVHLLKAMREQGYHITGVPESSDQILLDLIDRCSYDQTWLTEQQLAQAYRLPINQYAAWFSDIPAVRQSEMIKQWGDAPGGAYIHDGAFALAGLEFGNLFVALQPPRGYDMDPNAIYHRPDLPPPHNYYALYRWLRDVWQADAIIHMGKHGTLEWLPGKGVGLSAECYPDIFLDDLPLIYPFIINDPGEGNQSKRRAHAVIIDHMTPPMTSAGAYGALAELAQLVDEYYQMEQLDPSKLPLLQRQIWDVIQKNRLDDDLKYIMKADHGDHSHDWDGEFLEDGTPTAFAELQGAQVAHLLEDIEGYLCELTGAQIRDGLHILGTTPQAEQLVELLYHLLRLPNLHIPSLPASVAALMGEDWDQLQERTGERRVSPIERDGQILHSNADTIEWIEARSKAVLRSLDQRNWSSTAIDQVQQILFAAQSEALVRVLQFACKELVPKLRQGAHDEIASTLAALNGQFVAPGPSGAPTRGMAHVLPTGRNFYAVDPRALPSMAAWQIGQGLADNLIARYRREHNNRYPASVGISIWGTSAIRTAGDDIAEVLALLGVRPVWQEANRRVIGVEVIPLEELGRPRIDITCRISGFFRDGFPHLITLIDEAVQAVINLDEPLEHNFPRSHALAAAAHLEAAGVHAEAAKHQASYRIFGCAPGSYGAGILPLIDAQNWHDDADFAEVYLTWGGYAYTASESGVLARDAFARALSGVEVATKNQDNREHDIFDSDDYMQFHGGMIATIRSLTGTNPARYFGDSSDPARPRTRDLREEARRVFRSRVTNPKWIESMRRHGYKGALELAATVDYLFGYDATAQVLDDWMYHDVADKYLRDEELQQFFADSNPWAWQAIAERLLEAIDRGMWQDPDPLDEQLLQAAKSHGLKELLARTTNDQ